MNRLKTWGWRLGGAVLPTAWSMLAWAQQQSSGGDVTTTTTTKTTEVWYVSPLVWAAIGVAVFLIVVIALTNRGRRV